MSINANTQRFYNNMCRLRYTREESEVETKHLNIQQIKIVGEEFEQLVSEIEQMKKALSKSWNGLNNYKYITSDRGKLGIDYIGYYTEVKSRQECIFDLWHDEYHKASKFRASLRWMEKLDQRFENLMDSLDSMVIGLYSNENYRPNNYYMYYRR